MSKYVIHWVGEAVLLEISVELPASLHDMKSRLHSSLLAVLSQRHHLPYSVDRKYRFSFV